MGEQPPLPDYDRLTTAEITSHARTLDTAGMRELIDYERQHADRPQVLLALEHRLDALETGAPPSGGDPASVTARADRASGPSDALVGVDPSTEGPPQNPPSQGVPTNPAQPRG